jgi:hypothetical protein
LGFGFDGVGIECFAARFLLVFPLSTGGSDTSGFSLIGFCGSDE